MLNTQIAQLGIEIQSVKYAHTSVILRIERLNIKSLGAEHSHSVYEKKSTRFNYTCRISLFFICHNSAILNFTMG